VKENFVPQENDSFVCVCKNQKQNTNRHGVSTQRKKEKKAFVG